MRIALLFSLCVLSIFVQAQTLSQTIRGRVFDADSRRPIAEANLMVLGTNPIIATSSSADGTYRLSQVPVGRQNIRISLLGYEEKTLSNMLVVAGKEMVLEIELRESFKNLKDVVISSGANKSRVANDMALVSARGFSVEETKRYAGAINDPARMVASYAGVNSDGSGNNDIIVRGNNPRNIQWRLEGVEIPNPNHFASEGLTGGPINALNSQMLANSEFYTGAFNPQYGNALAGIFDMKLRTGNNEKREYSFSLGVLGTDITLEGPFKKGSQSSYLANYRYSTLSLLDQAGIVDFNGVPKYQDGSFKLFFPTKNAGTFTVFGLAGRSGISAEYFDEIARTIGLREKQSLYKIPSSFLLPVSLHFRIGDYAQKQDCHPVMPVTYYIKSIEYIIRRLSTNVFHILYFFEQDDQDAVNISIRVLAKKYPTITFVPCSTKMQDWEQMLTMSNCNHNIIANSSFSIFYATPYFL
jgi:hypothetical protein